MNRAANFLKRLPSPQRETWQVRLFGLAKVPVIGFIWPSVVKLDSRQSILKVPLNRRTRNHIKSMYLGTMCVGAELNAGILTMHHLNKLKSAQKQATDLNSVSGLNLLYKDIRGDFLKRATDDVYFQCEDGELIQNSVERCLESSERVNVPIQVKACYEDMGDPVARFLLTLSIKQDLDR